MVAVKKNKSQKDAAVEINSDVAAFVSSLGFSSSAPSSGFNDSDFRKTGSFKPPSQSPTKKPPPPKTSATKNPKQHPKPVLNQKRDFRSGNSQEKHVDSKFNNPKPNPKQYPKPAQNQNRDFRSSNLVEEHVDSKYKNLPKLPLVKSSSAGVCWHSDSAELEEKLIGKDKKIEFTNAEELKGLVEKKKELGERLLAQYAQEYMTSRGQHGDIKMLFATQRSGTAADKVSALSVLIGDNAVANLRAIDTLLGNVLLVVNSDSLWS